ncbi:adenosine deaminase [Congregibacter brevis]|uniref:Adenine deaminase n=1 Tax=Congregibacter brevis TaxID=3081201 RepID=A0ABZ0IAY7_9GAMM|nr:adenosine deaminase [Congregibacter sp. IMCC45268]
MEVQKVIEQQFGPVTQWLAEMPKAELHLHLDGSLRAPRLLQLAAKHGVDLPYTSVEEVEAAYNFSDLQSFLDLYYLGASVLRDAEDFYLLMKDYLDVCRQQKIVHCEIMVEPQTYLPQGVDLSVVLAGFDRAIVEAHEGWGQSVQLILSFLRHLPEADCIAMLEAADLYRKHFCAIGLASAEKDFPPANFQTLYREAKNRGYELTAHAGEEGPASFIRDALELLSVSRIDHGVRAVEDEGLLDHLAANRVPLTVCPLSNVRLCVYDEMSEHRILELLERGLCVTVNSDDPAYFGGDLLENFAALESDLGMTREQALVLVRNGFEAAYLPSEAKMALDEQLKEYLARNP